MWPENFGGYTGKWTDWLPVGIPVILFFGIMLIASLGLDFH
jgi:hypothetical protein